MSYRAHRERKTRTNTIQTGRRYHEDGNNNNRPNNNKVNLYTALKSKK